MLQVSLGGLWSCLLVCLLLRPGRAQVCEWDQSTEPGQGLDPRSLDAGARRLSLLRDVKDPEHCRKACCAEPDCQLALLGLPADDGTPECQLVVCLHQGRDVCVLQPSTQFRAYRKMEKEAAEQAEESPRKYQAVPLGAERPSNDSNNIRCRHPMKVGSCRAAFPKFYYDVTNQSCRPFIYGGCDANGNNFETQQECEASCNGVTGSVLPDESTPAPPAPKAARMLPAHQPSPVLLEEVEAEHSSPESGPAEEKAAAEEDEPAEKTATTTAVPAEETATTGSVPAEETVPSSPPASLPEMSAADFAERCEAEPKVGPCRASLPQWHYDSETRTCKVFIYGGCQGNRNNYLTEESCMAACTVTVVPSYKRAPADTPSSTTEDQVSKEYKEQCTMASDPGPCRAAFPMFYFEPSSGTCQSFIYGGCRGNNNRYGTMEECMARCSGTEGWFEERGRGKARDRWTPAFFLVGTLAVISALLLTVLVIITMRRNKLTRRPSSISDKEELLPDADEQSSVESVSAPGSPKADKI
ncbi:kunitz-type protease inhibitor 2 isoform X1 [Centroberyx gerrardi]